LQRRVLQEALLSTDRGVWHLEELFKRAVVFDYYLDLLKKRKSIFDHLPVMGVVKKDI